jgi:hypothetical protein
MSRAPAPQRQRSAVRSTRYLTKEDVRIRYGWVSKISVDRAWQVYKTLPKPTIYQGRRPLWNEAVLDAFDVEHAFDSDA